MTYRNLLLKYSLQILPESVISDAGDEININIKEIKCDLKNRFLSISYNNVHCSIMLDDMNSQYFTLEFFYYLRNVLSNKHVGHFAKAFYNTKFQANLNNIKVIKKYGVKSKRRKIYNNISTYIIKDSTNNMYKIGKSKNPRVRESTLQSEKPTLNIVKVFNKDIEKKLHADYKEYRIRGEWFKLNKIQVKYICGHY